MVERRCRVHAGETHQRVCCDLVRLLQKILGRASCKHRSRDWYKPEGLRLYRRLGGTGQEPTEESRRESEAVEPRMRESRHPNLPGRSAGRRRGPS